MPEKYLNESGLSHVWDKVKGILPNGAYYVEGSGSAAAVTSKPYYSARWRGSNANITSLYSGLMINYKLDVAGNSSYYVVLDINGLGEHPVCSNVNSTISTKYGVGCIVPLVYDATQTASAYINANSATTITGVWKMAEYDSTITYRLTNYYYNPKPITALYRYQFLFSNYDLSHVIPANTVDNKTSTYTKALTTEGFDPFGPIYYYASTTTVAAEASIGSNTTAAQYLTDLRYSFNINSSGTAGTTALTAGLPVFIKAKYNKTTHLAYFEQDTTSSYYLTRSSLTQTLPVSNPNADAGQGYIYIYIYLGQAYNKYQMDLFINHPVYYWNTLTGKIDQMTGASSGVLDTTATTAQSTNASESLEGNITLHKIAKTGTYSDLIGTPNLATVATSGSYTDLTNKPTIPDNVYLLPYGTADATDFIAAMNAGKTVFLVNSGSDSCRVGILGNYYNVGARFYGFDESGVEVEYTISINEQNNSATWTRSVYDIHDFELVTTNNDLSDVLTIINNSQLPVFYDNGMIGQLVGAGQYSAFFLSMAVVNGECLIYTYKVDEDGWTTSDFTVQSKIDANNPLSASLVSGLATVATSGSYNDLTNKPTIPSAPGTLNTTATTAQSTAASEALSGTITLHKIAKTGTYSDLIGLPTLGTAAAKNTTNTYSATGTDPITGTGVAAALATLPTPMQFKGTVGSSGTVEWSALPAAAASNAGYVYKVISDHSTAPVCKTGDTIVSNGSSWVVIPSGDEPSGTVTNVATGSGLTGGPITGSGTISHADTSSQASSTNSGRTYIQSIGLDDFGHVTSLSTATETVADTKVTQLAVPSHPEPTAYPLNVLLSYGDDAGDETNSVRKSYMTYSPTTKALTTGGTINGYTLNAASAKAVDTSISAASTSSNLPTSAAVASFVEGKGYVTSNTWRPVKYSATTLNDTSTTLEFVAGSNISLSFSSGQLTIGNTYSYTHPAYDTASAAAVKIGRDATGHVVIGEALTYSDVGAAASSHSHGNVLSGGTMTSSVVTSVTSDYLVFSDASNSGKIERQGFTAITSTLINSLGEGTSPAQRDDYIVAQYAGGGTSTITYHRRKLSNIFAALTAADIPSLTSAKISDFTTSARGAISGTSPISYNSTTGVITHAAALSSAVSSGLYKIATDVYGHVTGTVAVAKSDITALGIPESDTNTTYSLTVSGTGDNANKLGLTAGGSGSGTTWVTIPYATNAGTASSASSVAWANVSGHDAGVDADLGINTSSGDTTKFLNAKGGWTVPAGTYVHPAYDTATAAAVKIGRDSTGHVTIGAALTAADVGAATSGHTHTYTLNGASTTSLSFYAPTGAGTSGQYLKSNGSGAPSWTNFPTIPSITLNGSSTTSPAFYAPTSAGTSGYVLQSNGSGAPSWVTPPSGLPAVTVADNNKVLAVVDGAWAPSTTGSASIIFREWVTS